MNIDRDRRQQVIDLFPEACPQGDINPEQLLLALGVEPKRPSGARVDRELLHSLRNAIGVVQSGTRLLQRRLPEDSEAMQVLESIMAASQKLKGYADELSA